MNLKTYQATTMAQALAAVKKDLGRDAVILHTRTVRKGGLLGLLGGRRLWEVTASPNVNVPPRAPKGTYASEYNGAGVAEKTPVHTACASGPAQTPESEPGRLSQELSQIRQMVQSLLKGQPASSTCEAADELGEVRRRLLAQDVQPAIADELAGRLRAELTGGELADPGLVAERLLEAVAGRIAVAGRDQASDGDQAEAPNPGRPRVIALIGPTGVGKTTTIAKLAANFKLRERKRVGLITIDTYRIAAVDQLRTYAEIIDVSLKAVLTPGELSQAIQSMPDVDTVLIDTTGRSQNDALRLNQLRGFLAAARADEVHLVISACASWRSARNIASRFGPLGANRIILTKLDEAETFGMILNLAADGAAALSYVTTGQDVPDDIEPADATRLARRIVGGCPHGD